MEKVELLTPIESDKSFSDVLYLTNQDIIPSEIKRLLKKRKLSYRILPIDKFYKVRDRLDLIGTVIIDTQDANSSQQQQLARIIESLEMENIGMVLLTDRPEMPVKSFSKRVLAVLFLAAMIPALMVKRRRYGKPPAMNTKPYNRQEAGILKLAEAWAPRC